MTHVAGHLTIWGVNGGFQGRVKSPMNKGREYKLPGVRLAGDWPGAWTQTFAQLDTEAGPNGFDKDYFVKQVAGLTQIAGDLMLVHPRVLDLGWGTLKSSLVALKDDQFALWIDSADRGQVEAVVARLCAQLREPILLGQAQFQLDLHAGVAILGVDATTAQALLEHAAVAAGESRRAGSGQVMFFSDTLRMRSLARLDVAREMRSAIEQGHFRLRYRARHDLRTGGRTAWVGYINWSHPLRGSIPPREFLPVAQTMGLAKALSRSVLGSLQQDFESLSATDSALHISFGALRAHELLP